MNIMTFWQFILIVLGCLLATMLPVSCGGDFGARQSPPSFAEQEHEFVRAQAWFGNFDADRPAYFYEAAVECPGTGPSSPCCAPGCTGTTFAGAGEACYLAKDFANDSEKNPNGEIHIALAEYDLCQPVSLKLRVESCNAVAAQSGITEDQFDQPCGRED